MESNSSSLSVRFNHAKYELVAMQRKREREISLVLKQNQRNKQKFNKAILFKNLWQFKPNNPIIFFSSFIDYSKTPQGKYWVHLCVYQIKVYCLFKTLGSRSCACVRPYPSSASRWCPSKAVHTSSHTKRPPTL